MVIDNATLLQADTTAIVGIFIFLTLQGFGQKLNLEQQKSRLVMTSLLVIPFAFSAIAILIGEIHSDNPIVRDTVQQNLQISRYAAMIGFCFVLFVFIPTWKLKLRKPASNAKKSDSSEIHP